MKTMNCFLFLFLLLSALGSGAEEDSLEERIERGHRAYDQEEFEKALGEYRRLAEEHSSPSLYYNMGNAALRSGELGHAILYYRKAQKRAPRDEDIQNNLDLAIRKTRDDFENRFSKGIFEAYEELLVAEPLGDWWGLSWVTSLLSTAALILIAFVRKTWRWLGWTLATLFLFLTLLFFAAERTSKGIIEEKDRAVVLSPSVEVHHEPKEAASTAFVLHEGTTVEVRKERGDRLEIRTPDDQVGWVRKEDLGLY